jgi:hypothetical protein
LGAEFQILSFTATGAGAGHISDALEIENQRVPKPLAERCEKDAAVIAMKLLHVAVQIDNKQENAISNVQIYPILASVTENGYKFWSEDQLIRLDSMSSEE